MELFLLGIARFFEHTSGKRTGYQLYLVTIVCTGISGVRYLLRIPVDDAWPNMMGDPVAGILLAISGIILVILSNFLHERMMGGSNQ